MPLMLTKATGMPLPEIMAAREILAVGNALVRFGATCLPGRTMNAIGIRADGWRWLCAAAWIVCVPAFAFAQAPAATQDKPIGEAPEERPADDIFLRGQRVLLARGDVVVDLGQFYTRSDDLQLTLVNDAVALATQQQTSLTSVVVGRAGVGAETEIFAATSFTFQRNRHDVLIVRTRDRAPVWFGAHASKDPACAARRAVRVRLPGGD